MDKVLTLDCEQEIQPSLTDTLTGLFNHECFQVFLEQEVKRAQRYAIPFTLGLIDIDSFSLYNDRYGVAQGDRMLRKIAEAIKTNLRQVDVIARYSGDVFAILLETVDADVAFISAERIRNTVVLLDNSLLTVSIGLVSFPRDAANKEGLIQKAKLALQQAKSKGKNIVYFFEKETPTSNEEQPRVLLVDDDPYNLKLLKALLLPLNLEIIEATNGKEALQLLSHVEVDLILLDVMMPEMDGFDVCRRLKSKESTRMIPIILVTALDDMESKVQGIEAGADDFITRPPNKTELLARTKTLIKLKRLNKNLTSIENVLFSLANSIEAKDVYTQGHIERVSTMAVALGKKMELPEGKIEALRFGGILHDIGKLGIPEDLLNKPMPLNPEENDLMKHHPETGYKICLPLKQVLGSALDVIRHHHEKLDGSGYPDRLKGNEISMEARIMAVTDMYDALITDRPYRKGMRKEKVLEILRQEALEGKLDHTVVESLVEILT